MRKTVRIVAGAGALLIVAAMGLGVLAGEAKQDILQVIVRAPELYAYTGTMVSVTWTEGEAFSREVLTYHMPTAKNRWEFLDDKGRTRLIIIDDSSTRWEIAPEESTVYIGPSLDCCLEEDLSELARLEQNYLVSITGSALVAGRKATIVTLTPRYPGNPARVLWVDDDTGLVLRWEKYRMDGSLTGMGVFTKFTLTDNPDENLFRHQPGFSEQVKYVTHPELPQEVVDLQKQLGSVIRYPTGLPPGYRFSRGRVLTRFRPGDTVQLQFTDGLNSISVFQTFIPSLNSISGETALERATKLSMDSTQVYLVETSDGIVMAWSKGPVMYSIVGDVPVTEIKALAHSFRD